MMNRRWWIRIKRRLGFRLTSEERTLLAWWITRNVKTSVREILDELNE